MAGSAKGEHLEVDGQQVSITHPDKIVFPDIGVTKMDLIRYYLVPTEGYLVKPRLVLEGGALRTVNSPVMDDDELVATLAQRYRLHLVAGHDARPWPLITLRPRFGMPMTIDTTVPTKIIAIVFIASLHMSK